MKQLWLTTDSKKASDHLPSAERAGRNPVFTYLSDPVNGRGMLELLPNLIAEKLRLMGFDDSELANANEMIESLRRIYDRMDLTSKNYHNHTHNLCVTYAMLLLMTDIQEKLSVDIKKAVFVAALLHDFHIREKAFNGKQTAALVEETVRQISDLLGVRDRTYPGKAIGNARYLSRSFSEPVGKLKRAARGLVNGNDEMTYRIIVALIRRTDFASNVDAPSPRAQASASEIRSRMINSRLHKFGIKGTIYEIQLMKLLTEVEEAYENTILGSTTEIDRDGIWASRRKAIETTYIQSLMEVSRINPDIVPVVHSLACRLEKGADQAGFYWMSSAKMIEESILPGLNKEVPIPVTSAGTYPFFFKNELLTWDVIDMIALLPAQYKSNFLEVMRYFSELSSQEGRRVPQSEKTGEFRYALLASEAHWRTQESDIAAAFGLGNKKKNLLNIKSAAFLSLAASPTY